MLNGCSRSLSCRWLGQPSSNAASASATISRIASSTRAGSACVVDQRLVGERVVELGQANSMTLRMPSWASISSKPRLTSSSVSRCEMNGVDVDLAGEAALDQRGHVVAALEAAERRAADAPAGDQVARDDVERLAAARRRRDRAQAPAHPRRLDRLAHHGDVAGRLEGVVGAEAAGHLEDRCDGVGAADERVGRALRRARARGAPAERSTQTIRSAPCRRQPATAPRPTMPAPKTTHVEPALAPRRCASPRRARSRARRRTGTRASSGASGSIFASAISGITVYSANVEVPMKWRIGSPSREQPRRPVGQVARGSAARGSRGRGSSAGCGSGRTRGTAARTA